MRKKRIIACVTTASIMLSPIYCAHTAVAQEDEFINPPVNPLPSLFSISSGNNNDVPNIPPPVNPLPAQDVYIQKKSSTSSSRPEQPKNTESITTKKPKKKKTSAQKRSNSTPRNVSAKTSKKATKSSSKKTTKSAHKAKHTPVKSHPQRKTTTRTTPSPRQDDTYRKGGGSAILNGEL